MSTPTHAHLDEVYPLLPFEAERGDGVYLEAVSGRRVLDLYGGHAVALLGYGHPRLTEAVAEQMRQLAFQSNAVRVRIRDEAADALAAFAPECLTRVFFVNSGAEANENALRIAIRATGRPRIVALEHGFHGRTAGAAAVSYGAREKWYGFPQTPFDVIFVARDDPAALDAAVDADTAAVILEPVQGLAGAYDLPPELVASARAACTRAGALLIVDEVQTGMGRLGRAFGADLFGVEPDILTTAKGLAGGLPAGAVLLRPELAADLRPGELGTTFGGGPVVCAAIKAVLDSIAEEDLLANVRAVSEMIKRRCAGGQVLDFCGAGFLLGLRTKLPAVRIRDALLQRDILAGTSADPHILRLLPPLVLAASHVEQLAHALGEIANETL